MKRLRNSRIKIDTMAAIIILLIIVILACLVMSVNYEVQNTKNQSMITGGTVIDKEYTAGHTSYYNNGQNHIVPYYVGPRYRIKVAGDNGYDAWYDVIEQVYYDVKIGDYFSNINRSLK